MQQFKPHAVWSHMVLVLLWHAINLVTARVAKGLAFMCPKVDEFHWRHTRERSYWRPIALRVT